MADEQQIAGVSGRAAALLSECEEVGLVQSREVIGGDEEIIATLSAIAAEPLDSASDDEIGAGSVLDQLFASRAGIRAELSQARSEVANFRGLLAAHLDFNSEAATQSARLRTVELFRRTDVGTGDECPSVNRCLRSRFPRSQK